MPSTTIESLAITAVEEVTENLNLAGASCNHKNEINAVRVFDVELDISAIAAATDPISAFLVAYHADGIPEVKDLYPSDDYLCCVEKTVARKSPSLYQVTCRYYGVDDPLNTEPEVEVGFVSNIEPIDRDINDDPILNSSDETYDPPPNRPVDDMLLRITRYEERFDLTTAMNYKGTVNDASFYGFAAGQAKLNDVKSQVVMIAGTYYYHITYEIQFRYDGWKYKRLDEGYRKKTGTDDGKTTYQLFTDDEDNPINEPVLLDGSGDQLSATGDPVYNEYDIYRATNFDNLDLEYDNINLYW